METSSGVKFRQKGAFWNNQALPYDEKDYSYFIKITTISLCKSQNDDYLCVPEKTRRVPKPQYFRKMYAIVNINGQQFKVQKDQTVIVHRLPGEDGKKLEFNEVVMVDDGGKVKVGAPVLKGASVTAKIIKHLRGDKVIIFKKKRRKGYQKQSGHRQNLTKIMIDGITI